MRGLSIARSTLVALLVLALSLSVIAGFGIARIDGAREDYERELADANGVETATANVLAAAVIEEAVLLSDGAPAERREAQAAFRDAANAARAAAREDPAASRLVDQLVSTQQRARTARGSALTRELTAGRQTAQQLATREGERRNRAREDARTEFRLATFTAGGVGLLSLLVALGLIAALVTSLRTPLDSLVDATRRLSAGEHDARVIPRGPRELRELAASFNAMAAELDSAQARVDEERSRLVSVIESLGDALLVSDTAGTILVRNPRADTLVPELARGAVVGAPGGPLPDLEEALAGEVEVEHRGRTLSITAARLGRRDEGVVWTVRDVSERARLERLKSEFVATASHELRSPLTSIKGFAELLSATRELTPKQRDFVDVILLSTNRLVDLVSDLLDVTRIDADRLDLQRRPVDVAHLVTEVATLMRPRVEGKDQQLVLALEPDLPPAFADPARVSQIVMNLLTNAHTYTPAGGTLRVGLTAEGGWLVLAVSDTGVGLAAEELDRVFDRFYRGEGHAESGQPGSGLGLSIVRSLVDRHGGEITVRSLLGEGTTFTVRLPAGPAELTGTLGSAMLAGGH